MYFSQDENLQIDSLKSHLLYTISSAYDLSSEYKTSLFEATKSIAFLLLICTIAHKIFRNKSAQIPNLLMFSEQIR
jgi:hypothetical protein